MEIKKASTPRPKWLLDYYSGTDYMGDAEVLYEGNVFAVVRIKGRHYFSGLGRPWNYAPQKFEMIRKGDEAWGGKRDRLHTGRLTKAATNRMMRWLVEAEREVAEDKKRKRKK